MRKYIVIPIIVGISLLLSSCSTYDKKTAYKSDTVTNIEMPEPFDQTYNAGGDYLHDYYSKFVFKFGNINSTLINLVGEKEAEEWINEHISGQKSGTDMSEMTVLGFIEHFDITKEELTKAVSESNYPDGWIINVSDIEVIFSGDSDLITQTFVNEYALLHNGVIYTPEWLYNHSLEDYTKEELPPEDVSACMSKMSELPFTEEAQKAIADKSTLYMTYNVDIKEQPVVMTTAPAASTENNPVSTTTAS